MWADCMLKTWTQHPPSYQGLQELRNNPVYKATKLFPSQTLLRVVERVHLSAHEAAIKMAIIL